MWRVIFFFLVIVDSLVLGQLCTNDTEYQCKCKQWTDGESHLPVDVVDCSGLKIDTFPNIIEEYINYLSLSVNNIEVLDPKEQKLSSTDLNILILSYNKIHSISDEFFLNVNNLRELDLSYNYITTLGDGNIFQNLNQLTRLDLSYNSIKTLPDTVFGTLVNIRYLNMSYNAIGNFLTSSKDVLTQKLGISVNITHLSLNGLNITDLPSGYFDNFTNMKYLSLSDNAFTNIPAVPYSIEYLDISGNNITYISARYLNYHSLKVLKLNRMPSLTNIHHYAFYNLFNLEELSISDCPNVNNFSYLAFDVASKNTNLHPKYLSLARNGLTTLNESYKYFFNNMDKVDLRHNPWKCDCDILWLMEFESILYQSHEIKCYAPDDIKYKSLIDLKENDLVECHPEIYGKKSHRILIVILVSTVIVLCGLIFYLMKYPQSWLGTNHVVGPNSPYNLASTSEHI
ncbi:hypothetical protein NQ314_001666 [Rhamnusium bicolor]|uniref:Uncharacterized protein n=1 Tax=Rhamnusium bicolor TaxID=1586634 RepID=A0AAV8ZUH6_9CUCU|nr:hypothetical protein NQ314_001666 [Rhamnusium bicolor]